MTRAELQRALRATITEARRRGDDDFADRIAAILNGMSDD